MINFDVSPRHLNRGCGGPPAIFQRYLYGLFYIHLPPSPPLTLKEYSSSRCRFLPTRRKSKPCRRRSRRRLFYDRVCMHVYKLHFTYKYARARWYTHTHTYIWFCTVNVVYYIISCASRSWSQPKDGDSAAALAPAAVRVYLFIFFFYVFFRSFFIII